MRKRIPNPLTPILVAVAAVLVMFEETVIHWMVLLMTRLARLPAVQWIETRLATLPPYPALIAFLLPLILIEPIKLGAVWLISVGYPLTGLLVIVLGKLVGTALIARLYQILRPRLSQLAWFVRAEAWTFRTRDRLYARLRAMPGWQAAVATVERLKRRGAVRRAWVLRRYAAWRRTMSDRA